MKRCTIVTLFEGLSLIKWYIPRIMWSRDATWQIRNVVSCLPKYLFPSNLAEWWLRETWCNLLSHMALFLWGHQNFTSPLSQNVWPPIFQGSRFRVRCFWATKSYQLLIAASSVKRNIQIKIHIFILLDLRTNTLSYHTWWRNVKRDVTKYATYATNI